MNTQHAAVASPPRVVGRKRNQCCRAATLVVPRIQMTAIVVALVLLLLLSGPNDPVPLVARAAAAPFDRRFQPLKGMPKGIHPRPWQPPFLLRQPPTTLHMACTALRGGEEDNTDNDDVSTTTTTVVVESSDSSSSASNSLADLLAEHHNPFVPMAPLIMAATCQDGSVAIVAVHSQGDADEMEEPLLYQHNDNNEKGKLLDLAVANNDDGNDPSSASAPALFGGPYRIVTLGHPSMLLLGIGWRADCDLLADMAREWVQSEQMQLGFSQHGSIQRRSYALATHLSLQMAHRLVESVGGGDRPLGCAAMVIAPKSDIENEAASACIWWTDESGVYPVRVLAVGRDAAKVNAQLVRQSPLQHYRNGRQGLQSLLSTLAESALPGDNDRARVELAIAQPTRNDDDENNNNAQSSRAWLQRLSLNDLEMEDTVGEKREQ